MKLKKIIKESAYLGELPSSKLKKMKWNPVTDKEPVNELNLDKRMMGLVNIQDKRNLADAIGGYVHEFVNDGFGEKDIQKYMAELVKSYVSSNYRRMSR
jgi:hypothetical protein